MPPLEPLHSAVLLTVLYSDLVDQPLTGEELHCFLAAPCPDRQAMDLAIETLDGSYLGTAGGFVYWRGGEATIELRRRRQRLTAERWGPARRFARWLGWVPFLRMVGARVARARARVVAYPSFGVVGWWPCEGSSAVPRMRRGDLHRVWPRRGDGVAVDLGSSSRNRLDWTSRALPLRVPPETRHRL